MKVRQIKQLLELFDDEEEFEVKVNNKVIPIITLDYNKNFVLVMVVIVLLILLIICIYLLTNI